MSLAQITKEIRLSSKIVGALLALGVVIFLFFQGGSFIQKVFFPKPPPPPEEKFGELPSPTFPETSTPIPEYRINTVSGQLPVFSDRIRVYEMKQNQASITALKTAKDNAANTGFTENQTAVTASTYSWTNPKTQSVLEMDIITHDFTITKNLSNNEEVLNGQSLTSSNATESVFNIIDILGANTEDIDTTKTQVNDYAIVEYTFLPADPFMQKKITKVTLFQNPVDKIPIYYPVYNDSILFFYLTFIPRVSEIIEASYVHKVPNLNSFSTYPLKSTSQAFEELKKGEGYIVNPTTDDIVDITDVSLGYYIDGSTEQKYLLPIIVFQGKNDFEGYIQAIP